jgi:hypothetical protein
VAGGAFLIRRSTRVKRQSNSLRRDRERGDLELLYACIL